jgi:hypothetical protein
MVLGLLEIGAKTIDGRTGLFIVAAVLVLVLFYDFLELLDRDLLLLHRNILANVFQYLLVAQLIVQFHEVLTVLI